MNRNIKFRGRAINAWSTNKKDGDWIYGNLIQNEDASFIAEKVDNSYLGYCNDCDRTFADMYRVDPNTIGEYTGAKDANGVEIYEGDIVKMKDYRHKGVVKYINGALFIIDWNDKHLNGSLYFWNNNQSSIEVIGNIFENKELSEGENE